MLFDSVLKYRLLALRNAKTPHTTLFVKKKTMPTLIESLFQLGLKLYFNKDTITTSTLSITLLC